jgi:hypothetical protein
MRPIPAWNVKVVAQARRVALNSAEPGLRGSLK